MPVYLIQVGGNGPVKIGHTADPLKRLSSLQVAHHDELHLLETFKGDKGLEWQLHVLFDAYHLRGEWFQPAVLPLIDRCRDVICQGGDALQALIDERPWEVEEIQAALLRMSPIERKYHLAGMRAVFESSEAELDK